jgi:hypothetical protein
LLKVFDISARPPVDRALLKYWGEWMRQKKTYKKHLQSIGHSTAVVDAEIEVLKTCINQIHYTRSQFKERKRQDL